jgi:TRAP-type C4-dicarboxylate transport system permease small subunit
MAMLPPRAKLAFRIVAEVLVIAFFATIAWVGYSILGVLATDNLVSLPEVSVLYTQSVIPISAVLIIAAEIVTIPAVLAEALSGRKVGAVTGGGTH